MHKFLCFITSSLIFLNPLLAYGKKEHVLTPEMIIKMKRVSDPQLSPDGKNVAYVLRFLVEQENRYSSDIYLINLDKNLNKQITNHPANDYSPLWTSNGEVLAFLSDRENGNQVWIISLRGGDAEKITDLEGGISGPISLSSDDEKIVFLAQKQIDKRAEEKDDPKIVGKGNRFNQVCYVDIRTKGIFRLTDGKSRVLYPAWSPDSRKIAFCQIPSMDVNRFFEGKIYVVNVVNREMCKLTDMQGDFLEIMPMWSPDEKYIMFKGHKGKNHWAEDGDIFIVNSKGGTPVNLTQELDRDEYLNRITTWDEKGENIIFSFATETYSQLAKVNIHSKKIDRLIPKKYVIQGGSIQPDLSKMVLILTDPLEPPELWLSEVNYKNLRRLTNVNPEIRNLNIGKTEIVKWKSFDDKVIEGILIYPVGYETDNPVPMILYAHGGPQGAANVGFNTEGQMFAGAGFAFFDPNRRGSGGYGNDFIREIIGDWGGAPYEDIMTGVDYLINEGIVEENCMGVQGWSYGGYMTNWIVTHTNRFKAAVTGADISNLESFYATTDTQIFTEYYQGGTPNEKRDIYRKFSPVQSEFNVKTPVLIYHGENDFRTPLSQSFEFYHFLKNRGVTVEFIIYPREFHAPTEPNHKLDLMKRRLNWFRKYILFDEEN